MSELSALPGLDALTRAIHPVTERFYGSGYRLYLVGGVVRDLLLTGDGPFDPMANDIDLTTDALPGDIKALVSPIASAVWAQGERYGTIGANVGPHALEITTHRAEAYDAESRKPVVSFGDDLDEDLSRRDFTINAAAIELPTGVLHDPYDGSQDLAAGLLRTPLSPLLSFGDDPLRMMRAARFIARFGLEPSPELVEAATELSSRLRIVSVERVSGELDRLLRVTDPGSGLAFLQQTGLLGEIVPELAGPSADPTLAAQAIALAGAPGSVTVRLGGLLWPVRDQVEQIMRRLKYSRADSTSTARLVTAVENGTRRVLSDAAVRRIVVRLGIEHLDQAITLASNLRVMAEEAALEEVAGEARQLVEVIARLRESENLADLDSPLSGGEIIDLLGVEPGPEVGRAQRFLHDLRLDGGPLSAEDASEAVTGWWVEYRSRRRSGT